MDEKLQQIIRNGGPEEKAAAYIRAAIWPPLTLELLDRMMIRARVGGYCHSSNLKFSVLELGRITKSYYNEDVDKLPTFAHPCVSWSEENTWIVYLSLITGELWSITPSGVLITYWKQLCLPEPKIASEAAVVGQEDPAQLLRGWRWAGLS